MKVFERIIEQEFRRVVDIDDMQFGFMPGRGTMELTFIARQLEEKYLAKKKTLYFAFVDLENAFDRVPREVVHWVMRKLGVDEWLVETVMAICLHSCSAVRINNITGEKFSVKVGVHQGFLSWYSRHSLGKPELACLGSFFMQMILQLYQKAWKN